MFTYEICKPDGWDDLPTVWEWLTEQLVHLPDEVELVGKVTRLLSLSQSGETRRRPPKHWRVLVDEVVQEHASEDATCTRVVVIVRKGEVFEAWTAFSTVPLWHRDLPELAAITSSQPPL